MSIHIYIYNHKEDVQSTSPDTHILEKRSRETLKDSSSFRLAHCWASPMHPNKGQNVELHRAAQCVMFWHLSIYFERRAHGAVSTLVFSESMVRCSLVWGLLENVGKLWSVDPWAQNQNWSGVNLSTCRTNAYSNSLPQEPPWSHFACWLQLEGETLRI